MKAISLALLAAVSLTACSRESVDEGVPHVAALQPSGSYVVTADSVAASVAVEGTVEARHRAEIATRLMARVTSVEVELGSVVRPGQVLVRLGLEDVEASRGKAEAALSAATAARDEAARHAERMDTLVAQDVVPRVQRDQAHLSLTQAEAQLAVAEATVREVRATAQYALIEAPFAGVIVGRVVDAGDVAAPGMPLLVLESRGPREAILSVAPDLVGTLREGDEVPVTTREGRSARGRVRAVAGGADPATRTVEVRVELPADWQTGTVVTALVPVGARLAVMVPTEAIVRRGQLTGVQVVRGEATALRWIRLGRELDGRVEVLSGLEPGERIAL